MASVMRGAGSDPLAGPFGGSSFVAPGNPNASSASNTASTPATSGGVPAPGGTAPTPNQFESNPFSADPSALLQLLGAGGPGFAGAPPSAEARPPEERFQVQLQVRAFIMPYVCIDMSSLFSNYMTWASPTPLKTCVHCLQQAETFTRQ
jgi:hypothetical protein